MKIFISHSSKDSIYGSALVSLLTDIGVRQGDITFTSDVLFGIPAGYNIFHWLKDRMAGNPFVIYLLSDNYYSSVACLNEMGAAWMVENEHVSIFLPGFDLKSEKFTGGVLDPRQMGFYINNYERIVQFSEDIKLRLSLDTNPIAMDRVRRKFEYSINSATPAKKIYHLPVGSIEKPPKKPDDIARATERNESKVSAPPNRMISEKRSGPADKFFSDLRCGKLKDEEIMLAQYAHDTARFKFGVGWKTDDEVKRIKGWEEMNETEGILSSKYEAAINRFDLRKLTTVSDTTSHGNPREVELIREMKQVLIDQSDELHSAYIEVVRLEKARLDSINDEIPF